MKLMKTTLISAMLATATVGPANAAFVYEFGGSSAADGSGLTTSRSGATVIDFNGGKPAGYSGQGSVLSGSLSGKYATPAGDATPYLSVAYPAQSGIETFAAAPGASYNYFGLYWGSIDDYNSLSFYSGATLIASVSGLDVIQAGTALGDQTAAGSNRYVNFTFLDTAFDRIVFNTTQFAFESDNHAFGNVAVPEPATLALFGIGLLGAGIARRRKI
jgi:hypothetical protein